MQVEFNLTLQAAFYILKKSLMIKPRRVSQILLQATLQLTEIKETHYDLVTCGYRLKVAQIKIEIRHWWGRGCETMACIIAPPSV